MFLESTRQRLLHRRTFRISPRVGVTLDRLGSADWLLGPDQEGHINISFSVAHTPIKDFNPSFSVAYTPIKNPEVGALPSFSSPMLLCGPRHQRRLNTCWCSSTSIQQRKRREGLRRLYLNMTFFLF